MDSKKTIPAKNTITKSRLRRKSCRGLKIAETSPSIFLDHADSATDPSLRKIFEISLELIDDLFLIKTIQARKHGRTIKVKLEQL